MKLYSIETGRFKLDGGAMFGVVPKVVWTRTNPADPSNRINMAMRCLLIETDKRLILVDNGIGDKYDAKFHGLYGIDHEHSNLKKSLNALGVDLPDITDVILTHMHFDHCGGSTFFNTAKDRHEVSFKNAQFWVQKSHLEWALNPNPREKASFFSENILPIQESGQLNLLEGEQEFCEGISLKVVSGHTEGQQLPLIEYKGKKILFAGDLFPTYGHLPLPYVMGYDTRPLITMEERSKILPWLIKEKVALFYEHDADNELGYVTQNERGKYLSAETFLLKDLL